MAKINRVVTINGEKKWIHANNEQEYIDKVAKLLGTNTSQQEQNRPKHLFKEYAENWFELYSKPNIETVTICTYKRQLDKYLIPAFEKLSMEEITVDDVQRLFNSINRSKSTKEKVKMVLNQIFESAMDDGYISKNPLKSQKLKITGTASKPTQPYSVEQMRYLTQHIGDIKQPQDRAFLALLSMHPLRLEEVLGLQWQDIDFENRAIYVNRAATHPDRNKPEIKVTKTEASVRSVPLASLAAQYLTPGNNDDFVLGGAEPLTYTQVRGICKRIKKNIGFPENITPIRFRTTVLTDYYQETKDIKLVQQLAGHTTSAMTLKYYVKGRENVSKAASAIENLYAG